MKPDWIGIYPAVSTPFTPDLKLDLTALGKSVERLIASGVHGLVMLGTVGENTSLDAAEKHAVLEMAVSAAKGRVPVIAGVAEYTAAEAVAYVAKAEKLGVDGLMVLPAMVYKADAREVLTHFTTVAEKTALPILIYNNPVAYNIDVKPTMVRELCRCPNIEAVKESSEDTRRLTDIINLCGQRVTLMAGVDDVALESLFLGAKGWVAGLANIFPAESVKMFEATRAADYQTALEIYRWLMPSLHMDTHPKLVQLIKLAAQVAGCGTEFVRPPRLPLEGEERESAIRIIRPMLDNRPASAVVN